MGKNGNYYDYKFLIQKHYQFFLKELAKSHSSMYLVCIFSDICIIFALL